MENIKTINPIEITAHLKTTQFASNNVWICNIKGERREVTHNVVRCYAFSLQEAISLFRPEEIDKLEIHASDPIKIKE